jgi:hypothetical protein
MKEIVAILSHADTTDKLEILQKCLREIKNQNYKVMLSSHIEVPDYIKNELDYFLFDKENPLILNKEFPGMAHIYIWQSHTGYHQNYSLDYNHSYAVLKLIKNSLAIAQINGYEKIHFVNYDYVLYDDYILKNHSDALDRVDLFSYYYDKFEQSREHINTGLFSVRVNPYIDILNKINSKEDFLKSNQAVFEKYFYYETLNNNLTIELVDQENLLNTRNVMNSKSTFKHVIEDKIHVYLSKENNTENYFIYINSTQGDVFTVDILYDGRLKKWAPAPNRVNLLRLPTEILLNGVKLYISDYNYSDFYDMNSNYANCDIHDQSLIEYHHWDDVRVEYQEVIKSKSEVNLPDSFFDLSKYYDTDKVTYHGYHFFYPQFIEHLRTEKFNMLEIGWGSGSSVKVWNDYFPKAEIFVMDIGVEYVDGRQKVIKGDQSNEQDLAEIVSQIKTAKFIIDDGSHNPEHQLNTFYYLFKNLLEPGGIYIIEDIELSYWNPDSTLYGYKTGNVNILLNMIKYHEMINHEFTGVRNTLDISSITYGQNCIIIKKRTLDEKNYFDRSYRFSSVLDSVVNWG